MITSEEKSGSPGFLFGHLAGCYWFATRSWNISGTCFGGVLVHSPYGRRLYGTYPHAAKKQKAIRAGARAIPVPHFQGGFDHFSLHGLIVESQKLAVQLNLSPPGSRQ